MYYGDYRRFDIANGEGIRHSLFSSGCTHKCPGCFNDAAQSFTYGKLFTKELEEEIINDLKDPSRPLAGLSLLGGEPFQNVDGLLPLVKRVKKECAGKNIWSWSGYTFEQILESKSRLEMLQYIDVLVDGKFVESLKDLKLPFRGSSNQRVIDVQKSLKEGRAITIPKYDII